MALPKGAHYPAFPQPLAERGYLDQRAPSQRGLTLLDHLASEAMLVERAARLKAAEAAPQA